LPAFFLVDLVLAAGTTADPTDVLVMLFAAPADTALAVDNYSLDIRAWSATMIRILAVAANLQEYSIHPVPDKCDPGC
jgi:hypothetical protein